MPMPTCACAAGAERPERQHRRVQYGRVSWVRTGLRPQAEVPTGGGESPGESAAENPPTARKGDLACDIAAVVVSCCEGTTEQTAQTATGCARVAYHATRRSTIGRAPDRALVSAAGQL